MIKIDSKRCKGCALCVGVCHKKIIALNEGEINASGFYPAECVNQKACISCLFCATICPETAIEVEEDAI